ncbi:hypothetical protein PHSY_006997 [Pseudozyma hubeiensis SY62]|uniref:Uncharacterized protein n=1 Tax=Pseudozyma hubeiensis (strain SY62) TaxID=1305764 RepID=R9PDH6_PSEHS|nr:hypothetical protein PHSY_006997 [Pseudozyma hubeiensis SY62]GAC99396.1 hypothetical protein PHSY_006997 [Pseudozyma hubeiensis SY62]
MTLSLRETAQDGNRSCVVAFMTFGHSLADETAIQFTITALLFGGGPIAATDIATNSSTTQNIRQRVLNGPACYYCSIVRRRTAHQTFVARAGCTTHLTADQIHQQ